MKYIMIDIFFGWMTTPILYLNLMQIFIMCLEIVILAYVVKYTYNAIKKIKLSINNKKNEITK